MVTNKLVLLCGIVIVASAIKEPRVVYTKKAEARVVLFA